MNRRVTLVTALSVAGTAAVAAMSFAIVYEPADDPSAGVPLLDTTSATVAGDGSSTADPLTGAAPLPVSVSPAAPIVAAPVSAPPAAAPGRPGRTPSATTPRTTDAAPATAPATSPSPIGGTQPTTTAAPAITPAATPATTPAITPAPAATTVTSTTTPAPSTTVAARPEGVPADWPANKPIPPMPTGCLQPQLEDDGVWNCQH